MENLKLPNIPSMSVDSLVKKISYSFSRIINSRLPVKNMPSIMLWGPPGVGKSQAIRQIAKEIEKNTNKHVNVTDVRLLLFNPIDLRGIPTSNADKTLAIWLKPKIFDMDSSDNIINILFLDEISAAPQSVQAAAYQITLDRVVGEHKLPENCIVIAAGNRVNDKSVVFKMPKALANRLMHIEIIDNFNSWKKWAIEYGINKKVIGFLSFKKEYLMCFKSTNDDLAYATPRTWEMVSNILNNVDDDVENMYSLIAGLVGCSVATEFRMWCKVYNDIPSIEDIFNGKVTSVPKDENALYLLVSSMATYARNNKDNLKKIENSIKYAERLPFEFEMMLMKDYMYMDSDYKKKLLTIPEFVKFIQNKGKVLNEII